MTDVKVSDLLLHTAEQRPSEFDSTFDTLIKDRLVSAIHDKKMEIAKTIFNSSQEYEYEEVGDEEDSEDYQEEDDDA